VRDIVRQAFDKAVGILRSKRAILERTAQKLLEKETLGEADLKALVAEPAQSAA
jgi:cell division protease FtsH